jgi:signal transduction histidine kinase
LRASEAQLRLVVVRADRRTLHQIIVNLTNNATKFTDRGSVQLELCQGEEERQRWV